ncbi:MAG: hypothetical protein ACREME_03725, partial [Gemmatimonadales bacterium]
MGCASRSPSTDPAAPVPPAAPPGPPPAGAATPPAGARDVVELGPSALRYRIHQQIHVEQEFQGQTSTVDRGISGYIAATITGPVDSVGYPLALTIDSIVPDSGTVLPPTIDLQAVRGLTLRGRLAPTGEFRDPVPSDTALARIFAQIIGSFQTFYPRIPAGGLTLGAEWMDTTTTTDRAVVEVTTTTTSRSRAVAWEQRNDARALRLEVMATYTLVGAGDQGGQVMELTGSGTRSSVQFLAADGRYLGGEARDSSAIMINLPVQNATVPVRQVARSVITVIP